MAWGGAGVGGWKVTEVWKWRERSVGSRGGVGGGCEERWREERMEAALAGSLEGESLPELGAGQRGPGRPG